MKTIAVDLDDVLNNFTETLQHLQFVRDETHALSEEVFQDYLAKLRSGWTESGGLLSTEYSFFRKKIHQRCYERARARADGIRFMQWLRQNHWRIVICTYRDLRRAQDCTRKWLGDNEIPFDYLFMTRNKIAFCKAWRIEHLIDDEAINIALGQRFGVHVYYPSTARSDPEYWVPPAATPSQRPKTIGTWCLPGHSKRSTKSNHGSESKPAEGVLPRVAERPGKAGDRGARFRLPGSAAD